MIYRLPDDWYYPWNHGRPYDLSLDFFQQLYIYIYILVTRPRWVDITNQFEDTFLKSKYCWRNLRKGFSNTLNVLYYAVLFRRQTNVLYLIYTQVARFMGPPWGPSGDNRTQVGPMLAPWTLLSGCGRNVLEHVSCLNLIIYPLDIRLRQDRNTIKRNSEIMSSPNR